MTPRRDLVTRGGETLSLRIWALLRDAYEEAGLDPDRDLVVTQGSYSAGTLSGSTHLGGGAFDLRVWNFPVSKRAPLVNALRRRNAITWERSARTGSWSKGDHLHGIVADEPDLSSGALWQVREFRAGRDGLARQGKDYHPRPKAWRYRKVRLSNVKPGAKNSDVKALQYRLGMPARLQTGYYGPLTRAAVAARWPLSKGVVREGDLRRLCFWVVP
jgi:hypothetical protein